MEKRGTIGGREGALPRAEKEALSSHSLPAGCSAAPPLSLLLLCAIFIQRMENSAEKGSYGAAPHSTEKEEEKEEEEEDEEEEDRREKQTKKGTLVFFLYY
jgi:hypothetical protein